LVFVVAVAVVTGKHYKGSMDNKFTRGYTRVLVLQKNVNTSKSNS